MAQQEYERSQTVDAPPEEVFAWLSDVGNLPKYLPPVVDASVEGTSAEGAPGQRIRTTLEHPTEEGMTFDAEGYLVVDEAELEEQLEENPAVVDEDRGGSRSEGR